MIILSLIKNFLCLYFKAEAAYISSPLTSHNFMKVDFLMPFTEERNLRSAKLGSLTKVGTERAF